MFTDNKVSERDLHVPLLQFADDALLMGDPKEKKILGLKTILRCFEMVPSLKINFHKSRVFGVGVPENRIRRVATILNCQIMKIPFFVPWFDYEI
ncbi:hypothetical protein HKD37_01G001358 [Glycine soja]